MRIVLIKALLCRGLSEPLYALLSDLGAGVLLFPRNAHRTSLRASQRYPRFEAVETPENGVGARSCLAALRFRCLHSITRCAPIDIFFGLNTGVPRAPMNERSFIFTHSALLHFASINDLRNLSPDLMRFYWSKSDQLFFCYFSGNFAIPI